MNFQDDNGFTNMEAIRFTGRSLSITLIIFNIGIAALMSSMRNIQKLSSFSKLSYAMVFVLLILFILGVLFDVTGYELGVQMALGATKILFLTFNFGIFLQLNTSLNHETWNHGVKMTFLLALSGVLATILTEFKFRVIYLSGMVISLHTLKLLREIKNNADKRGMVSMQLIALTRLEWIICILHCIVWLSVYLWTDNVYDSIIVIASRNAIRFLVLIKIYIITVYFSADSQVNKSTSAMVHPDP